MVRETLSACAHIACYVYSSYWYFHVSKNGNFVVYLNLGSHQIYNNITQANQKRDTCWLFLLMFLINFSPRVQCHTGQCQGGCNLQVAGKVRKENKQKWRCIFTLVFSIHSVFEMFSTCNQQITPLMMSQSFDCIDLLDWMTYNAKECITKPFYNAWEQQQPKVPLAKF